MEASSELLEPKPVTNFSVVHYKNLFYPEIDPFFVHHYLNQLKGKWYIMNDDKTPCVITFNRDYENPTIIKGWNELKKIYNLHDDVEVTFEYYPPKCFTILSFKELTSQQEIPPFHSRSLNPTQTRYFDIILDAENIKLPTLKLPTPFAEYLKDKLIDYLIICGDRRIKDIVTVLDPNDATKTSLGHEWKHICEANFFKVGDNIRFKFDLNDTDQRCHVFKLSN